MKSQSGGDPKSMTPQLEKLDKTIQGLGGSFFGQQIVDITDLILGPRLHHMEVMLKKQGVRRPPPAVWASLTAPTPGAWPAVCIRWPQMPAPGQRGGLLGRQGRTRAGMALWRERHRAVPGQDPRPPQLADHEAFRRGRGGVLGQARRHLLEAGTAALPGRPVRQHPELP